MTDLASTDLRWEAPEPGFWRWQGSHVPGVPTPIYGAIHLHTAPTGVAALFERYGVPLRTMDERLVNGRLYATMAPLLGRPGSKVPPKPVLWLATRLHPTFRRRNRAATAALANRIWRARTVEWREELRPSVRAANLALQAEPVASLDDGALADHVRRVHEHVVAGHLLHFDLHGDDMGPLGMFLCACRDWGIAPGEAIATLTGHSPSTTAAVDELRKVAVALDAAGGPEAAASTLDELRMLGSGVAGALDAYLEEYGWRVVTGYDLDARTVCELPEVLLANVRSLSGAAQRSSAGQPDLSAVGDAAAAALRDRVPADQRGRFDEALGEARIALDLRDDNGPITIEWPVGLLRRALLEVGRRAVERGVLAEVEHAVELELHEVLAILGGAPTVTAGAVAQRAAARAAASAIVPPATLGQEEAPPDLSAFPPALAAVTDFSLTCVAHLEKAAPSEVPPPIGSAASGLGVGTEAVRGTARVAKSPEDALASLAPGEVLVVPFTTPAYNAVLAVAGGLVTEEGGALSHAAVLARELALPAVIGVPGILATIGDGDEVELDPVAGTVRVLAPA
jgi:pyruvate,water dikinase